VPGEINCIFTKGLIPFVEREVGPEATAAVCRVAGHSRDYLMADHNWIPLAVADQLVGECQRLMREPDEERWARRYGESFMDWKPREERSYLGTYSMGIGHPRAAYQRLGTIIAQQNRACRLDVLDISHHRARYTCTPLPGHRLPLWTCTWLKVQIERFPTNWGLPRAHVLESTCAARGDDACRWEVRWKNPSLGASFWAPTAAGVVGSALLALAAGLRAQLNQGASIAIHCRHGIGRSSTLAAAVLVLDGLTPAQIWERITVARGLPVPDTGAQRELINTLKPAALP